jgi:hypothetical protein
MNTSKPTISFLILVALSGLFPSLLGAASIPLVDRYTFIPGEDGGTYTFESGTLYSDGTYNGGEPRKFAITNPSLVQVMAASGKTLYRKTSWDYAKRIYESDFHVGPYLYQLGNTLYYELLPGGTGTGVTPSLGVELVFEDAVESTIDEKGWVHWNSVAGELYVIESSADLTEWSSATAVLTGEGIEEVYSFSTPDKRRFYRVRRVRYVVSA